MDYENSLSKKHKNKELFAIDVFKFICAILVVIIHVSPFKELNEQLYFFLNNVCTRIAVPFFFVCTGYFIFRKFEIYNIDYNKLKKVMIKMISLYFLWVIIYIPVQIYDFSQSNASEADIKKYLFQVFFNRGYYQFWYLRALFVALIIISILFYFKVSLKKIFLLSFILFFIGLFETSYQKILGYIGFVPNSLIKLIDKIMELIGTTRNGSCFALLFVVIGIIFAWYPIKIKPLKALIFTVITFLLMTGEIFLVANLKLQTRYDKFLLMPLVIFFLFSMLLNIKTKKYAIGLILRKLSMWIYFLHYMIYKIVVFINKAYFHVTMKSYTLFFIVIIVTLLLSIILTTLSNTKHFKWLNKLI